MTVASTMHWFKLNTDGFSKGNPKLAQAEAPIRNFLWRLGEGFLHLLGHMASMDVEIWDQHDELFMAIQISIPNLEIQLDSELAILVVQRTWLDNL